MAAADQDGDVVDVYLQARRNRAAALFFRRLLRSLGGEPRKIVTEKLRSYPVAHREVIPESVHVTDRFANNRAEHSHEATGVRDTRSINSDHEDKLRDPLSALDSATEIADMDLPGWRLHSLKRKDKGRHAISVSRNWRMAFKFENGDAYVVDYEDYH